MSERNVRPFDKATVIAFLALLVSFSQLALTTPLLLEIYFKPELTVTDLTISTKETNSVGFSVYNSGNKKAENVELSIIAGENDRISVMPDLGSEVTHNNSVWVRTYRILVPYLSPKEGFSVIVHIDPESPREAGGMTTDGLGMVQSGPLPAVTNFRSSAGPSKIEANEFRMEFVSTNVENGSSEDP